MRIGAITIQLFIIIFVWSIVLNYKVVAQTRTGCKLDSIAYTQVPLAYPPLRGQFELPKKVSLKPWVPSPQNQGEYGTCVAWAAAYAARTMMLMKQFKRVDSLLVQQYTLSPFFLYESIKNEQDNDCQEGVTMVTALEMLKNIGTVPYRDFKQPCGEPIAEFLRVKAQDYRIADYRRLFELGTHDKTPYIKKSLSEGMPVMAGIECCAPSFLKPRDSLWKPIDNEQWVSNNLQGHALTVIGYDDNLQAFEVVNSWGNEWGNQGFLWISYSDFNDLCFEAYQMLEKLETTFFFAELSVFDALGKTLPLSQEKYILQPKEALATSVLLTNSNAPYQCGFWIDTSLEVHFIEITALHTPWAIPDNSLGLGIILSENQINVASLKAHLQGSIQPAISLEEILKSTLIPAHFIEFQEGRQAKIQATNQWGQALFWWIPTNLP